MADYKSRSERRQAQQNQNPKGKKKKRGLFKKILLTCFLAVLVLGLAGTIAVAIIIHNAPPLDPSKLKVPQSTRIYYNDGTLMTTLGERDRIYAPIDKIPQVVKDAVISIEDQRFYQHFGIDPIRVGGSIVANITHGFGSQGASTLDQQIIKSSYLTPKKTMTRKIQEAYLAVKLDREYSKDQILEMYLNKIYYDQGAYGVATAAHTYFGLTLKNFNKITLAQAAMLAGIPNLPTYYDPITHPEDAKKRRDIVLDAMVDNHKITQAQADEAKKVTIKEMLKNRPKESPDKQDDHYAVIGMLKKLYVDTGKIDKTTWDQGGLQIYTTIDKNAQQTVERLLNNDGNFPGVKKNFQAGIAVTDTQNGNVLAIGGGRHYKYGTNYAISGDTAKGTGNQIGSTAKPIIDYGPAIEYMKWPTNYPLVDEPWSYTGGKSVSDWDNRYKGKMTMRSALYESRNVPAVKTLQEVNKTVGTKKVIDFANKVGVDIKDLNESYALGSFTANPLQMAAAYAAFGNNGVYNEPNAIKYIDYPGGRRIKFDHGEHQAMHDYTAYMITDMLKDVIRKQVTYHGPSLSGFNIAGKSGSSNPGTEGQKQFHLTQAETDKGYLDSWFVGYTPKVTTAVWSGYDTTLDVKDKGYVMMSPVEKGISGSLFGYAMRDIASTSTPDWQQPNSVARSGDALYVRGTQPIEKHKEEKPEKPDAPKHLKAKYNPGNQTVSLSWDYGDTSGIKFEVAQQFNGNFQPLTQTSNTSVTVNNLQPGQTYVFSVTALSSDDPSNKSSAATVQVKIPGNSEDQGNGQGDDKGKHWPPPGRDDGDKDYCKKHPDDQKCTKDDGDNGDHNGDNPGGNNGDDDGGGNNDKPTGGSGNNPNNGNVGGTNPHNNSTNNHQTNNIQNDFLRRLP